MRVPKLFRPSIIYWVVSIMLGKSDNYHPFDSCSLEV
jgi:hypothetical protein